MKSCFVLGSGSAASYVSTSISRYELPIEIAVWKSSAERHKYVKTVARPVVLGRISRLCAQLLNKGVSRVSFVGAINASDFHDTPEHSLLEIGMQGSFGSNSFYLDGIKRLSDAGLQITPGADLLPILDASLIATQSDQHRTSNIDTLLQKLSSSDAPDGAYAISGILKDGVVSRFAYQSGTDNLLEEHHKARSNNSSKMTLTKVTNPKYGYLFQMAIGPRTVELASRAGVRNIEVMRNSTIVIDQEKTKELLRETGIKLTSH